MESNYFASELHRVINGDAWHGPSLRELLDGVNAETALAHPLKGRHSIWEIVNHLIVWHEVVVKRIDGEAINPTGDGDWPPVKKPDEQSWLVTVDRLYSSGAEAAKAINFVSEAKMNQIVPGMSYPYFEMVAGLTSHDACHAGQISLLKKVMEESGE